MNHPSLPRKNHHAGRAYTGALAVALVLIAAPAHALTLDLGSDESDGALVVATDTELALPADGVFNFTTITIDSGATLSFSYSGPFHPGVVLLATGDVVIDGSIDVSGQGSAPGSAGAAGPGGSAGGAPTLHSSGDDASLNRLDPSTLVPSIRSMGIRTVGATGGYGSRSVGGVCTTPGAGGGGGGGALMLFSNGRVSGAGTIDAGGGLADSAVPTGGCSSDAASDGGSGRVRIAAGSIDLAGASVTAYRLRLDTVSLTGTPTLDGGTSSSPRLDTGFVLHKYPAVMPAAAIVAIDGVAVAPSSVYALPAPASQVSVTVRVTDCTATEVTASVTRLGGSTSSGSRATGTPVDDPTGSEDIVVDVTTNGYTVLLYPGVACGPSSSL